MRKRDLVMHVSNARAGNNDLRKIVRARDQSIAMLGLRLRKRERERREAVYQLDIILGTINPLTQQAIMLQSLRATLVQQGIGDLP